MGELLEFELNLTLLGRFSPSLRIAPTVFVEMWDKGSWCNPSASQLFFSRCARIHLSKFHRTPVAAWSERQFVIS